MYVYAPNCSVCILTYTCTVMYLYKYMYMYCMWQEHCVQLTGVCSLVSSQLPGGREGSRTALALTPVGTQRQAVHKPQ